MEAAAEPGSDAIVSIREGLARLGARLMMDCNDATYTLDIGRGVADVLFRVSTLTEGTVR
jgi:actin-like ATPase involved in cell morphogenesis